jgi:hypothetical protein
MSPNTGGSRFGLTAPDSTVDCASNEEAMTVPLPLETVSYDELVAMARRWSASGASAHLHTTPPGCVITGSPRRAIVLESTSEGRAFAWFSDEPIEALARPMAILLHGADSVPDDAEPLEPACAAVARMADRMRGGHGHFHILDPSCHVNPHSGRWTILFEDEELGTLESVSDQRPLDDIRLVEQLIYRA